MKYEKVSINFILIKIIVLCLINNVNSKEKSHKCGAPEIIPKKIDDIPNKNQKTNFRRKLDSEGFQDFNIILDK